MPLTIDFRETVRKRIQSDPSFRYGLLQEAIELLKCGDVVTGRSLINDWINAVESITSDEENASLLQITSGLVGRDDLTPEETILLVNLATRISAYERVRYPREEKSTPSEILAFLMEENHLTKNDFFPAITQKRLADILAGKRNITFSEAEFLGERFKVNPSLFLAGYPSLGK